MKTKQRQTKLRDLLQAEYSTATPAPAICIPLPMPLNRPSVFEINMRGPIALTVSKRYPSFHEELRNLLRYENLPDMSWTFRHTPRIVPSGHIAPMIISMFVQIPPPDPNWVHPRYKHKIRPAQITGIPAHFAPIQPGRLRASLEKIRAWPNPMKRKLWFPENFGLSPGQCDSVLMQELLNLIAEHDHDFY